MKVPDSDSERGPSSGACRQQPIRGKLSAGRAGGAVTKINLNTAEKEQLSRR